MPNDNIERAVKKGTGELAGETLEEIIYEGYGPGGVAILLEVVTDNRNRVAADLRSLFGRHGGSLADVGSVAYLFQRKGEIRVPLASIPADDLFLAAIECGSEDVGSDEEDHILTTPVETAAEVADKLRSAGIEVRDFQMTYQPTLTVTVSETEAAGRVLRLLEALDDYDDTQKLHTNFEMSDAVVEAMAAGN
jgi:YebC/PmpR family DNA-binding regulatory protein